MELSTVDISRKVNQYGHLKPFVNGKSASFSPSLEKNCTRHVTNTTVENQIILSTVVRVCIACYLTCTHRVSPTDKGSSVYHVLPNLYSQSEPPGTQAPSVGEPCRGRKQPKPPPPSPRPLLPHKLSSTFIRSLRYGRQPHLSSC